MTLQKDWDFFTEIIGEDNDKFYILETLDGNNYRCLAPWIHSKTYGLAKFRVLHILKYFKEKHTPNRPANYHALMEKKMVQNMFLSRAIDIEGLIDNIQDTETNTIRNDICDAIIDHIKTVIKRTINQILKIMYK